MSSLKQNSKKLLIYHLSTKLNTTEYKIKKDNEAYTHQETKSF